MHRFLSLCLTAAIVGCDTGAADAPRLDVPAPAAIASPAAPGSAQPFVASAGDQFLVSWTEPTDSGHALRFARVAPNGEWSEPGTVAAGDDWFVNWADFPSVVSLSETELAAHWLQRSGEGTYAYDVVITRSADGGRTWSEPVRPHSDGTQTEHGFVSLFPHEGGVGAVWLDGRRFAGSADAEPTNQMTVRFTTLTDGPGEEVLLDERACDCCQTAAALTSAGPLVAYRDRSPDEIRDISVTRLVDGEWTEPRTVHDDGWYITGCPVNGPQADADGDAVALAWYTQAADTPRVNVAFSADAGATFSEPVRVDDGAPLGRVDLVMLDDGSAFVVWLERAGEEAEVRGRIITPEGERGASRALAGTTTSRAGGFPRMARAGDAVMLAWTDTGDAGTVRLARIDLPR